MATVFIQTQSTCAGGDHKEIALSVNGNAQGVFSIEMGDIEMPVTEEEKFTLVRLLIKLRLIGKTPAQVSTTLNTGLTVTV